MRRTAIALACLAMLSLAVPSAWAAADSIRMKGSDTIGGKLAPDLAEAYLARGRKVGFTVEALGSGTAFVGLFDGSADIGNSSRPINEKEQDTAKQLGIGLREVVIGYDGVAVVVNPANPVRELSIEELSAVFTGKTKNWRALGGPDRAIILISRPSYSGTHSFFKEKAVRRGNAKGPEEFAAQTQFVEENGEILARVAAEPGAISYVGLGWVKPEVKAVPITPRRGEPAIAAATETVRTGRYPLYRALLMYLPMQPRPVVIDFLRFILSSDGAAIVSRNGFVPLDSTASLPQFVAQAPQWEPELDNAARRPEPRRVASTTTAPGAAAAPAPVQPAAPAAPAAPEGTQPAKPARILLRVPFAPSSTGLTGEAVKVLDEAADKLKTEAWTAAISGHADARGPADANRRVAQARAEAVSRYLTFKGVPIARLRITAAGSDEPVATNESASGRAQNRRVDVELLPR